MNEKTQRRLLSLLALGIGMGLSRPLDNLVAEAVPERRGLKDDVLEAALQGLARATALFVASLLVRRLAELRR